MSAPRTFSPPATLLRALAALVALGAAGAVFGLVTAPERTWPNLLVDSFYALSIGVSALFFFATQRLTSARWSVALRRVPEAFMLTLPVAAVLMVVVYLGRGSLYPWAAGLPHEGGYAGKTIYLEPTFTTVRMAVVLVVWIAFALAVRRVSLAQDGGADRALDRPRRSLEGHGRLNRLGGAFAPVFAFTFTMAAYDWIISLEPDWFSTMFAVYVFAGTFVQGIAAITLAVVLLHRRGLFGDRVGGPQFHDLGKMMFAFSTFWAYIWVCQYLLIWYGNIPEEVTYYIRRTSGAWLPVFLAGLIINWIIPFLVLLPVRAKHNPRVLAGVSALLLFGHWLDLYIMVMPSKWAAPAVGPIEVSLAVGAAALVALVFVAVLGRAPLVPTNDPVLASDDASRGGES